MMIVNSKTMMGLTVGVGSLTGLAGIGGRDAGQANSPDLSLTPPAAVSRLNDDISRIHKDTGDLIRADLNGHKAAHAKLSDLGEQAGLLLDRANASRQRGAELDGQSDILHETSFRQQQEIERKGAETAAAEQQGQKLAADVKRANRDISKIRRKADAEKKKIDKLVSETDTVKKRAAELPREIEARKKEIEELKAEIDRRRRAAEEEQERKERAAERHDR